jgi:hypothetical protein
MFAMVICRIVATSVIAGSPHVNGVDRRSLMCGILSIAKAFSTSNYFRAKVGTAPSVVQSLTIHSDL